jgi:hypothetical protein
VIDFLRLWNLEYGFVQNLFLGKDFMAAVDVGWDQIGEFFVRGGRSSGKREGEIGKNIIEIECVAHVK